LRRFAYAPLRLYAAERQYLPERIVRSTVVLLVMTVGSIVFARRTPEWFSRADDEAIFFYYNRKELEIGSLAELAPNDI
jgi:hypothetical protein